MLQFMHGAAENIFGCMDEMPYYAQHQLKSCKTIQERNTMDYNRQSFDNNNQNTSAPGGSFFPNPGQNFAMISMILGAGCLFTFFTVYLPIFLGSLAVILAVISKGYAKKMLLTAKIGMIAAISSLAVLLSIIALLCTFILSSDREALTDTGRMLDQQIETQMGGSSEDIFGISYEELMEQYADMLGK